MSNRFIPERETGAIAEPGAARGASGRTYEFGPADNEVFIGLARAMKIVGILSMVFGALEILAGIGSGMNLAGLVRIGEGTVLTLIGGWLVPASGSLAAVARTIGDDIGNLMEAMRRLRSVYTLQAWLLGLVCVLVLGLAIMSLGSPSTHAS